jgi:hypothetical protein
MMFPENIICGAGSGEYGTVLLVVARAVGQKRSVVLGGSRRPRHCRTHRFIASDPALRTVAMITFSAGQGPTLQAASHTRHLTTHARGTDVCVPLERYWVLSSCSCASASDPLKRQVIALEHANMDDDYPDNDAFDKYFSRSDLTLHVCVCQGELLGFAIASRHFVHELHATYFRCGIGSCLLRALEASGECRSLSLHVHPSNTRARAFYVSMGFTCQSGDTRKSLLLMSKEYPSSGAQPPTPIFHSNLQLSRLSLVDVYRQSPVEDRPHPQAEVDGQDTEW